MRIEKAGDVVTDRLRKLGGISWGDLFSRNKRFVKIEVRAEKIDIDRAAVFISDLNKITKGAFAELSIDHLIHLLYDDFLMTVRENMTDVKVDANSITQEEVVKSLIDKRKIYFPRTKRTEVGEYSLVRKKWLIYDIHLRRDAAQRGDVFLNDAASEYLDFEMSLAELISILFVDFVAQLRKGNQKMLINALLDRFYSHDFD
ncbi:MULTISPECIES: hypothetical protein [unclassified Paenibacillus]|uniref:hypothetical protein n=1 Tax=unclassified Paenibacillus TaxID=185978 RepID=UPI00278952C4|nr:MULTISPECIES: hypothetical protein [unclassified Paenibacillus]MDQ0896271.1 hypothetical protein [Paenibacillus sp. V4I7]MDQ0913801.1 hypothetical protein [Paenibacillus sp. V4I5]